MYLESYPCRALGSLTRFALYSVPKGEGRYAILFLGSARVPRCRPKKRRPLRWAERARAEVAITRAARWQACENTFTGA